MPSVIPVATRADLDDFRALCREYAGEFPFIATSLAHQGFEGELTGLPGRYAPPGGSMLLIRVGTEPGGCVALRPLDEPGACEMKRMFVRAVFRGQGLGLTLANAIVAEARRIGYARMLLDSDHQFHAALAIYRRLGFRDRQPYNTDPCPHTVWMELELAMGRQNTSWSSGRG